MKTTTMAGTCVGLVALMLMAGSGRSGKGAEQKRSNTTHEDEVQIPKFQVDPSWPKVPNGWVLGQVSWVASDAQGNIWVLQRPRTVTLGQKTGPPVMEFDQAGNYLGGWGGPGTGGYDWPRIEHGIFIDYKGYVWICGSGKDDQVLKFTKDGKFVMQIGKPGLPQTNENTAAFNRPTDMYVYRKTNEVFISDGYGNQRVIVFDADTGEYKRMWGAFGNAPHGPPPGSEGAPGGTGRNPNQIPPRELTPDNPGPLQFDTVHDINISSDDLVYVADRGGKRVQVFTIAGKYLEQVWIDRWCEAAGQACGNGQTAASVAFSADPQQRFLYVASRSPARIRVFDRKTLQPLYAFGRPGIEPGEFFAAHGMETDTKGNLYTTEVEDGKRVQKFVFKGLVWLSRKDVFDAGH